MTAVLTPRRRSALGNRGGGSPCAAPGCGGLGTGGKPYCMAHLELMPEVRRIRSELVAGGANVDPDPVEGPVIKPAPRALVAPRAPVKEVTVPKDEDEEPAAKACPKCGKDVPPVAFGRPRIYCSDVCKANAARARSGAKATLGVIHRDLKP